MMQRSGARFKSAPSSIAATGAAFEIADLFEYRIAQPVTIKKNQSAMLPFLQSKIKGRKVVLYSDQTSVHPLNAAELSNSTGETLDGGPVTVFDAGAYAGEALVETVKAGDKRLISYGGEGFCGPHDDFHDPQRRRESQDADYRRSHRAGVYRDQQPEAHGDDGFGAAL